MNDFDSIIKRITVTRLEPGDYTGEDGLLYCGKCRTPKQFRMEARRHRQAVADLKGKGFTDPGYERLDVRQRQRQMPADETRPLLR